LDYVLLLYYDAPEGFHGEIIFKIKLVKLLSHKEDWKLTTREG